ncbi:complement C1q-like protein 3 [Saccostrea echinata]|uniref:complement C1q-like protein 3 n=1 Tax=Saccostrea echinata TaxID=191078 RepID=UPI002A812F5A|nr:complement C1q-like protein 3 [Saccostrea echinata]
MYRVAFTSSILFAAVVLSRCHNNCRKYLGEYESCIETHLHYLKNKVDSLDEQVGRFSSMTQPKTLTAFQAQLSSDRTFNGGSIWKYDQVLTNVGSGYNPATGKFIVPRNGVYLFTWYSLSAPKKYAHPGLFVDGRIKGRQASYNKGGGDKWITTGSTLVLKLQKGNVVCIMDAHGSRSQVSGRWTAFGGVQIS